MILLVRDPVLDFLRLLPRPAGWAASYSASAIPRSKNRSVRVLAGTIAAEPVERELPSGDEVTELRLSVPETGRRLLPLPVTV